MAYDAERGQVVLLIPSPTQNPPAHGTDTWTWDGTSWTMKRPATIPPARFNHAMAYDASTHTLLLTGGAAISPGGSITGLTDSWSWDGLTWTRR